MTLTPWNFSLQVNIENVAPTSHQDIGEAKSLQDDDQFNFGDFSRTNEGMLLMSSAAPISLQDSDPLQDSDASDRGDFVNGVDEFRLCVSAEDLELYALGLYYPICIGEVLMKRYRIEHKIRHDDISTVWLARDIKKKRDVALKIMVSGDQGDYERGMQKKIMSAVQEETHNLVTYLAAFSLPGRKGTNNHQVLVFPVLGPNFSSVMLNQISMTNRMAAAWQLLKALECLHNAKIVHDSDLLFSY